VTCALAQVNDDTFAAAKSGDLYNLRKLRQANWKANNPKATDGWQKTALHYAAEYDHADVADSLINHDGLMKMQDYKGRNALMLAAQKGNSRIIKNMVKFCAKDLGSCTVTDDRDRNALHYAANNGQFHVIKDLAKLFNGSELDKDDDGRTALMLAVVKNHVLAVEEFLAIPSVKNTALTEFDNAGMNVLHLAFRYGNLDVLHSLIRKLHIRQSDLKKSDQKGRNIFHLSAMSGNSEAMLEVLLEDDLSDRMGRLEFYLFQQDNNGDSPLHYIFKYGDLALFNALKNLRYNNVSSFWRAVVAVNEKTGESPVHSLLRLPSVGYAEIIENGEKYPTSKVAMMMNLFHGLGQENILTQGVNLEMRHGVQMFKRAFVQQDKLGYTPLLRAIEYGDFSVVREIINELDSEEDKGSYHSAIREFRKTNNAGQGPAQILIDQHRMDALFGLFSLYRQAEGNIDHLTDQNGHTPLLYAVKSGNNAAVELALRFESSVTMRSSDERTPLMWALIGNKYSIAENLLRHGANPNAADNAQVSCLHYAVGSGDNELVNLIIHAMSQRMKSQDKELTFSNITPKDKSGSTPLETAAYMNNHDIVLNFINRYAKFEDGWTEYAEENGILGKYSHKSCNTPGFHVKKKTERACKLAEHAEAKDALEAFGPCCKDIDNDDDWQNDDAAVEFDDYNFSWEIEDSEIGSFDDWASEPKE